MQIPDFRRLFVRARRRVWREIRSKWLPVHPPQPPTIAVPKPEPPEIIQARWRYQEAIDRTPRDQAEVNRRRAELRALELPFPGIHRRGRVV